ncbi:MULTISPECIES: aliphatic sulfonate ABC transporter permease SsuC [unclassified Leptolyngbya]|uniref:aliphatic sulfonate ABC transporter permease SsuC n=1 Tax=unclassified Leptolyngbya TaxID=2650499 RepID=UPI001683DC83|nr:MULTISPECIES: aliphatic sulfonate ABC transporter permease SsuC [unclassified Leptolyngbya]MBD1913235.1 aliphatic sulfonate ABC transporter permease SsuC [Leptolyngbya sp. FACHB-8]MBD2153375.1 aliphatic sulfonate ABC transporter permease SsuC [Leptolyngbya sp. FACHB-16]
MQRSYSNRAITQIIPWILPITLLILWQVFVKFEWLSTRVLPAPSDVVVAGVRLTLTGELSRNLIISTVRAIVGFLIGGSIGFALGLLNGIARSAEKALDTSVQMIRNIPHLALIPLVILWFGIGEEAKIFLVALGVFFPIYLNTFHGVRSVDSQLIEMAKSYGLQGWSLFRKVIFPGALSSILVGVRYALGIMWLTLIVAETITLDSGIGYMAMNAREFMQTDVVVLSILMYAILGKLADSVTRMVEKKWLKWNPNYQSV